MNLTNILSRILEGETVTFETSGNSMTPKINSGDTVTVSPITPDHEFKRGDIVLVKVRGNLYLHLVSAIERDRVQISNNHGRVNGWTLKTNVFGIKV